MKKTISLIILWMLTASGLLAQTTVKDRMDAVAAHFGVNFVYESGLALDMPCEAPDSILPTLEENLAAIFSGTGIRWSVRRNYVTLKYAPAKRYTIRGHVTDAGSSETLIAAGVLTGDAGTVTNEFGFYSITLPEGDYDVSFSYLGYDTRIFHLHLDKDTVLNAALNSNLQLLQAATITSRAESGIYATRAGSIELPKDIIDNAPVLLGETDVLKTLQMLPGVQGGFDGFSGIFVRGGADDENLLLLDGVQVYNAAHMLGIFSAFTPEAVKKVTLYKGDFPARYGGRISSVVDVRTKDGDMYSPHGTVSVGLLSDKLHLEGPIRKGTTSYSVSARVLHTFLFTPALKAFNVPANYYFYDFNGKVNHRFSDRDRLYAAVYHGHDFFQNDDYDTSHEDSRYDSFLRVNWGNTLGSVRWNHVYGERLFSNATIFANKYKAGMKVWEEHRYKKDGKTGVDVDESITNSGVTDYGVMMDFDWNPVPEHAVRFGAAATLHVYNPSSRVVEIRIADEAKSLRDTVSHKPESSRMPGGEFSLYAEDDFVIGSRLRINAGAHLALFTTQGKAYFSPQPRVSARYDIGGSLALKAGYSRMAQYIHKLSSGKVGMPTDLWVPITKNIRPVTSNQTNIGAVWSGLPSWEFSADAFLKFTDAVLEYRDAAMASAGSKDWDKSVAMGKGRAYGLELLARKTEGKTTGWVAYTLSKTDRIFPDGSVNNGNRFPYMYDRRHVLVVNANHKFNDRIDLSAAWNFASGAAMSIPTRVTEVLGYDGHRYYTAYIPAKGNYRLPPSHRLDVSMNFTKQKKRGERIWNIGVYNLYGRKNPNYIDYDIRSDVYGGNNGFYAMIRVRKTSVLMFLPSFSYTYRF